MRALVLLLVLAVSPLTLTVCGPTRSAILEAYTEPEAAATTGE